MIAYFQPNSDISDNFFLAILALQHTIFPNLNSYIISITIFGRTLFFSTAAFLPWGSLQDKAPGLRHKKGLFHSSYNSLGQVSSCMTLLHVIETSLGSWHASLSRMFHGTINNTIVKMWNESISNKNSGMCEGVWVLAKSKLHVWRTLAL